MELVYLWVEDYKNIKKQGFNFSPKFDCFYDEKTQKLTIKDKKYIKNFFGENINITAIVGENGAGKTSLLEFIKLLSSNSEYNLEKFFILYKSGSKYKLMKHDIQVTVDSLTCTNARFTLEPDDNVFWISYKGKVKTDRLANIIKKQSAYNTSYDEYFISKHVHVYNKYNNILMLLKSKYKFTAFEVKLKYKQRNIFDEKNIVLNVKYETILSNLQLKKDKQFQNFVNNANKKAFLSFEEQLEYNVFISYIEELSELIDIVDIGAESIREDFDYFMNKSLDRIIEHSKKEHNCNIIYTELELYKKFLTDNKSFLDKLQNRVEGFEESILYLQSLSENFALDDNRYTYTIELSEEQLIDEIISKTQAISDITNTQEYIFNFIDYDFINLDTNIKFSNLSSGEQSILEIIVDLIHHLDLYNNKNSMILADEIDNSLHPQWNKTLILELIDIFKNIIEIYPSTNIHLVVASHSPFILSDLSKDNVILLEKNKETGNCKNVTNDIELNPFGANIHTLLSHGFFMKDGLVGDFAKGKINDAISRLKKVELDEDDIKFCEEIISIIGEPIIKRELQRTLDSKRLGKIDLIEKQIKELQKDLETYKNDKN